MESLGVQLTNIACKNIWRKLEFSFIKNNFKGRQIMHEQVQELLMKCKKGQLVYG